MRLIGVGDNVVDCYLDEKIYYPGGNAVNVAVQAARNGLDTAYIGVVGNDEEAEHLLWALDQEGVDHHLCRRIQAISGHPGVCLTPEGDRVFVSGAKGTAQHIVRLKITPEDCEYICQFDICHTSCYSSIESDLPKIANCCPISYDFSSETKDDAYLQQVCPYIRYAFFSGSELTEPQLETLIGKVHSYGVEIVGITLGGRGALFSWSHHGQTERFRQGIKAAKVIDTMGAGDSFIAGFLTSHIKGGSIAEALEYAATRAAATCEEKGGFGYGKPFPETMDLLQWVGKKPTV